VPDSSSPRVTIGMPVYNGERFLGEALDSILAQSFADFELVISDNGSSDGTQAMCETYAARDGRIRYYREDVNRGAAWNYNRLVELARGEYFKWAAHDDLLAPTFLERCVEGLDRNPAAVLCFPDDQDVDIEGRPDDRYRRQSHVPASWRGCSPRLSDRVRNLTRMDYDCEEVFGLIRLETLRRTRLIQSYTDSDRTLLVELGLYGPFQMIPERLFLHRHHPGSSVRANPIAGGWHERVGWFDPTLSDKVLFSEWRQLGELLRALWRAPVTLPDRAKGAVWIAARYRYRAKGLAKELTRGLTRILLPVSSRRRTAEAPAPRTGGELPKPR
jgi:glycosyltransferase involved in cell wall biosynthesis